MPGFTSWDDFLQEQTVNGKKYRADWNKNHNPTTAAVAGEWHFLTRGGGNPGADALFNTGTNLTWQPIYNTTTNASSIQHGGDVAPDYKYITNASAFSAAATTMPSILMLVDVLGFYRVTSVTTITAQSLTSSISSVTNTITGVDTGADTVSHTFYALLTGTRVQLTTTTTLPAGLSTSTDYYVIKVSDTSCSFATSYANAIAGTAINITDAGTGTHTINTVLPRYTNGAGVQAVMWNTNATPMGAATPNLSLPSYTNAAQSTGRATPTVLPVGKTAASNTLVLYSGTGAGKYGPFVPLQAGDTGIAKADQVQLSVSYVSGEFSIALVKPLITMPMTTIGVASEREFFSQISGGLPRVYDGAALYWLLYSGAATPTNSAFYGHLDFCWG
jgi:hypothetical protein